MLNAEWNSTIVLSLWCGMSTAEYHDKLAQVICGGDVFLRGFSSHVILGCDIGVAELCVNMFV